MRIPYVILLLLIFYTSFNASAQEQNGCEINFSETLDFVGPGYSSFYSSTFSFDGSITEITIQLNSFSDQGCDEDLTLASDLFIVVQAPNGGFIAYGNPDGELIYPNYLGLFPSTWDVSQAGSLPLITLNTSDFNLSNNSGSWNLYVFKEEGNAIENSDPCSHGVWDIDITLYGADEDGDGVCDENEIPGCTNPIACNYNSDATDLDPGSCIYTDGVCQTCAEDGTTVIDNDSDNDGLCDDVDNISGCTNPIACNYDASTTVNADPGLCTYVDGVCESCVEGIVIDNDSDNDGLCDDVDNVSGCTNPIACNYDASTTVNADPGLCTYVDGVCESCVEGIVIDNDSDNDGLCDDVDNISGCTNPIACNYDASTTVNADPGLCTYVDGVCESCVEGIVIDNDSDNDGLCDDVDNVSGCTNPIACNYDASTTVNADPGLCTYVDGVCESCVEGIVIDNDSDNDGLCDDVDNISGCTNPIACNYDASTTVNADPGLCTYVDGVCESCVEGIVIDNDSDNDGLCDDVDNISGCTNPIACNYDASTTVNADPGLCTYVDGVCESCVEGIVIDNDSDNDGLCDDVDNISGCTNPIACNYDASTTVNADPGLCTYVDGVCESCVEGIVIDNDSDNDGLCDDVDNVSGCTNPIACNYDASTTVNADPGLCTYVDGVCESCVEGIVIDNDSDNDGLCDDVDNVSGCTNPIACNYDASTTVNADPGLCTYVDGVCESCVEGIVIDNDSDNDGLCDDVDNVSGCTNPIACNYDASTTVNADPGLCTYVDGVCESCVEGIVIDNDSDNDGLCDDVDNVSGCTNPIACNYDASTTVNADPGLCTYVDGVCESCVEGIVIDNDSDNDGLCDDVDNVSGCTNPIACNYDASTTVNADPGLCTYVDGVCESCVEGIVIDNDSDNDGLCDDVDNVSGCTNPIACNYDASTTVNADPGLCTYVDGVCESCVEGIVIDNDSDNDGLCDDVDNVSGCTNPIACNYDASTTVNADPGLCTYVDGVCESCVEGIVIDNDSDNDGLCDDVDNVSGCTNPIACNYDASTTVNADPGLCTYVDGVCESCVEGIVIDNDSDNDGLCDDVDNVSGCTNPIACNYDASTTVNADPGLCTYVDGVCESCVEGIVIDNDSDNDGLCDDVDNISGCTNPIACNYDASTTVNADPGLCTYVDGVCESCVEGIVIDNDSDNDGLCDDVDNVSGCTNPIACNYDASTTVNADPGLCTYVDGVCESCVEGIVIDNDSDNDGLCDDVDNISGCTNPIACNYDASTTVNADPGLCTYVDGVCESCVEGIVIDNDSDNDGLCDDVDNISGCTNPIACNYDASTTVNADPGLCTYVDGVCESCVEGIVIDNDSDNDGLCDDVDNVSGCTNPIACNYDASTTVNADPGLCTYVDGVCESCVEGIVIDNDSDNDGLCDDVDNVSGCTNPIACNYDASTTVNADPGLCTYVDGVCESCVEGIVIDNDSDNDGLCDDVDNVSGCTNPIACNYDASTTVNADPGLCTYVDGVCESCVEGIVIDNDSDNDGLCDDVDNISGCTNPIACNYDASTTVNADPGLCTYVDGVCESCVEGIVIDNDSDNDGLCDDVDNISGCTNPIACNYDASTTVNADPGLCTYVDGVCESCVEGIVIDNDSDNDGLCDDVDNVSGCTNPIACNYDASTTVNADPGLCTYVDGVCESCVEGIVIDNDSDNDGLCDDVDNVSGCTNPIACNYDASTTVNADPGLCTYVDGVCESCVEGIVIDNDSDNDGLCDDVDNVSGCTNPIACNYDASTTVNADPGLCTYVDGVCESCVEGIVIDNDSDNDGLCDDVDNISGCTNPIACNYDASTTVNADPGLCTYVDGVCESCVEGIVIDNDSDNDGLCDDVDNISGCTNPIACNYDASTTVNADPGLCTYVDGVCESCVEGIVIDNDSDNDGLCDDVDNVSGCTNPIACNYDASTTVNADPGLCTYVDGVCESCVEGIVIDNDSDNDGLCDDVDNISGCTNPIACNYDASTTVNADPGLCTYVDGVCESCVEGIVIDNDSDNDGLCDDVDNISGCTNPIACNYDASTTVNADPGLCTYVDGVCESCVEGIVIDNDSDNDGLCDDVDNISGCTNPIACNYDASTTVNADPGLCTYVDGVCESCVEGIVIDNDSDNDGVCDENEIDGCTDQTNPGYNSDATEDDGSCLVGGCILSSACNYDPNADYLLFSMCDFSSCLGCMDENACNFDEAATVDNASCEYPLSDFVNCEGVCLVDIDADGICDEEDECVGALDECGVCNGPGAVYACGCSEIPEGECDCDGNVLDVLGICGGACELDENENGVCDTLEIYGCMDSSSCNYNPVANYDSGECDYTCYGCLDEDACNYDTHATIDDGLCEYESCACPADLNNDGIISVSDILVLLAEFGCSVNCENDINGDGGVNIQDLLIILSVFNTDC